MKHDIPERYTLAFRLYPYAKSPDQDATTSVRHKAVVVGGGPIGLATALDLGRRGVPVVLLDDHEGAGLGSRALCFAKRTLEICDRLGAAKPMLAKGVQWNLGKVFHDDRLLYEFNLLPEGGHAFPAFINLQQPWFEKFLHDAIVAAQAEGAPIELDLVENTPNDQARLRYAAADLVIDQLNVGWYGLFSIESMALGKPCIVRLDAEAAAATEDAFGTTIPLVNADRETLTDTIRGLVREPERLTEIGRASRAYVEQVHGHVAVAERMLDVYRRRGLA